MDGILAPMSLLSHQLRQCLHTRPSDACRSAVTQQVNALLSRIHAHNQGKLTTVF